MLMAYQGSTEAGQAVADVIFGKVDPSGKLPVTWPSDAAASAGTSTPAAPSPLGDEPKFFDQLPCTGSGQGSGYNPLYPFGYGLSYTTFTTSGLSVTPSVCPQRHGDGHLHGDQHRSGPGTDIVPVYVHQPVSAGRRAADSGWSAFTRVTLDAGPVQDGDGHLPRLRYWR